MVEQLKIMSITDSLTGIFNLRHFVDTATRDLEQVKRYHSSLSMIHFEIRHFKKVNDSNGHAGDLA